MKQISMATVRKLALADKKTLKSEIDYEAADWLKENARHVASIEVGTMSKTLYGEWPKGWKAEMKRVAIEKAEQLMVTRFITTSCFKEGEVIWLNDHQMIQQLKGKNL